MALTDTIVTLSIRNTASSSLISARDDRAGKLHAHARDANDTLAL